MRQPIFTEALRFQVTKPLRESVEVASRKNDMSVSEYLRAALRERIARDARPEAA